MSNEKTDNSRAVGGSPSNEWLAINTLHARLRDYADAADAAEKLHWAKAMRDAAEVIMIFASDKHIAEHFHCREEQLHVCHECDGFGVCP